MVNQHIKSISLAFLIVISTFAGLIVIMPTASAGISGNIAVDTTWSGTVYIEGNVIVDPGVTLTIDPGTEVRFNGIYDLYVEGNLSAIGTQGSRIQFISNLTVPGEADWDNFGGSNTAHFQMAYCDFKHFLNYCNFPSSPTVNNTIENCTFSDAIGTVGFGGTFDKIINCSFPLNWGVYLGGSNNYMANCTFTNDALYLYNTDANVLENNVIYSTWGMEVNSSDDNVFRNFEMDGELYLALNSNNNTFDNFTFTSFSGIRAIQSGGWPEDNFVVNSTVPFGIPLEISMSDYQFINTTFDKNTIFYHDVTSEFTSKWYMHVNVTYSSGLPVPNANVWVNNTLDLPRDQYYALTDANGFYRDVECYEYQANDSDSDNNDLDPGERLYYTPHNVTVEKDGMWGYADVTMDATKVVNIVLVDDSLPSADSYAPTGTSVALDSDIFIQWNDTMNWTTVENSFNYTDGTTTWDSSVGTWAHNGVAMTSTFTPIIPFDFDTHYWVDINPTATDAAGNPLDQDKDGTGGEAVQDVLNWTFTTASNNLPTISISSPDATSDWTGGTNHAIWWNCTDVEDTAADSLSVFLNYTSSDGSGAIAGPLANETAKPHMWALPTIDAADVVVQATVIDSNGAKGYFDTAAFTIDSTQPQLIDVLPPNNITVAPPHVTVYLTFDEPMSQAETEAAFTLENSTSVVAGTFSWNANSTVMTFDPTQGLALNTTYWANLTTGAEDDSEPGNAIASFNSTKFTTIESVDNVGPAVTIGPNIEPSTIVYSDVGEDPYIWINATIDDLGLGNNTIAAAELMIWNETAPTISGGSGIPMNATDGAFDEMNETVTIDHHGFSHMPDMSVYYWVHGQDSEGNWGDWELVILQVLDSGPPEITSYSPTGTDINPEISILFSFDEEMDYSSVWDAFTITPTPPNHGNHDAENFEYNCTISLDQNQTYTVTINSSIAKDTADKLLDGNKNGISEGSPIDDVVWTFTTWLDSDNDGVPEDVDPDDDNDGVNDTEDAFPLDPDETVDTDGDGIGDNADPDDDGDGVPDSEDLDPLDPAIGGDTTPPSAPANLNLTVEDTGILVKWEVPPEDDVHHYAIYRSTDGTTFERIGNITSSTSYLDTGVADGTTYYYKVTAVDDADNESPFSDVESTTWNAPEDPPTPPPNDNFMLYLLLIIVIIVAVVVVLVLMKRGGSKSPEPENDEVESSEIVEKDS